MTDKKINVNTKPDLMCTAAMIIAIAAYFSDRYASYIGIAASKTTVLFAMASVIAVFLQCALIYYSKSPFWGIMASLLCVKLIPPAQYLKNADATVDIIYFVASRVFTAVLLLLLYKWYKQQKQKDVKAVCIMALLFVIPFTNTVSAELSNYLLSVTGTMMAPYFIMFLLYAIDLCILFVVAYYSNSQSMYFVCVFESVCVAVQFTRKLAVIILNLTASQHISKSYYCWCALYIAAFIVFAAFAHKAKTKEVTE